MYKIKFFNKFYLAFCAGLTFFLLAFSTLPNYGISWDEPTHFKRGQGYLWFLLTGDNDYHKLPKYNLSKAQNDPSYHERSFYQDDKQNALFYRTIDGSHPPLADILSSLTNMIFYQKLGWMGDIESYHLFEIFVSSIGVAMLFLFVYESFGLTAAFFSAIFLATYPLFWAESHFNIKDPIETTWIILTLYFLWKGIQAKAIIFIFLSSIFAGFALGTKFNVIFLPFIILPWFVFILKRQKEELIGFIKSKKFILSVALYPLIMFLIFYISYPFLWENPVVNIGKVLTYYEKNALDPAFANAILPDWPFYAVRWVLLSSPPLVLFGLTFSMIHIKGLLFKHNGLFLLALLWFSVTVVRVSIPGVNIYGGVRQIMEYIPAIAILAGTGFAYILANRRKGIVIGAFLVTTLISIIPLIMLHPNENVYFNFISGGVKGAVESGVPAAGNSFGNAYYQGIPWINENAEQNAKLTLIQGSTVNIPRYWLRSDIDLSKDHFSGVNRLGEYLIELTFNYEHRQNFYAWEYVDKILEPIFEVKAEGGPIMKIWKNDLEHTKPEYRVDEKEYKEQLYISKDKNKIKFETRDELYLSRIIFSYDSQNSCFLPDSSVIETSVNGQEWLREKDPLTFIQVGSVINSFQPAWQSSGLAIPSHKNPITFYFAGRKAKFIRIILDSEKSCVLNNPQIKLLHLGKNNQYE